MLLDELFQLAHQLACRAELEVGLDPLLERREPHLLEPAQFVTGKRLERQVLERAAAPETERRLQLLRSLARLRAARLRGQPLEARQVELLRVDPQHVPGRLRDEQLRADRLSQPRDVVLERGGRRSSAGSGPQTSSISRSLEIDSFACKAGTRGGRAAAVGPGDGAAVLDDRQRAENAEFDGNVAVVALAEPDRIGPRLEAG